MFNFGTIGAYKQVRNNPRCKATAETQNGQVVKLDEAAKTASFPSAAADAQADDVYVAFNIVDKPEVRNTNEFKIEADEYVRAFRLADLVGLPVLVGHQVITTDYSTVSVGDVLVPEATTGNWVVADGTTVIAADYAVSLEVISKGTFADQSVEAIVHA